MDGRNDGAVAVGTIDPKKADRALRKIFRRFFPRQIQVWLKAKKGPGRCVNLRRVTLAGLGLQDGADDKSIVAELEKRRLMPCRRSVVPAIAARAARLKEGQHLLAIVRSVSPREKFGVVVFECSGGCKCKTTEASHKHYHKAILSDEWLIVAECPIRVRKQSSKE